MALETPARIAPCGIEEFNPVELTDLFFETRSAAEAPGRKLHPASGRAARYDPDLPDYPERLFANLFTDAEPVGPGFGAGGRTDPKWRNASLVL